MNRRFEDKIVVVTGAGSGIGRATARLFADEGARVIAFDLDEGVEKTAAGRGNITAMRGDAGVDGDVHALIAAAIRDLGGLDIVVANAGISGGMAGLFEQTADDWAKILAVNLIGPFLAIKHGARAMLEVGQSGAIVCTASVAGLRAGAGGPAYSASKAGVINLVHSAAQQLSGTAIRVNAVCPGLIETGMTQSLFDAARTKGREELIGQLNPMHRGGEPEELAEAIAFLASDQASYINGHALVVDGGLSSSHPFAKPRKVGVTTF
ncbi:MAG: SDR family oxidoreductase [Sphingomonadaceae bacterium]|nr:SDR family oxidoreductase [Sphingobium sp.]MBP9158890.1 SDR family oxidoreductase [Sphingobium sp.]MCC6482436.1 SDR family oxidoreductase [Sphingomonadaceae bacterium]